MKNIDFDGWESRGWQRNRTHLGWSHGQILLSMIVKVRATYSVVVDESLVHRVMVGIF